MNLLFITPYLPDENAGAAGSQLMWRTITGLADKHRILLVTYVNPGDNPTPLAKLGVNVFTIPFTRFYGPLGKAPLKLLMKRLFTLFLSFLYLRPYELQKYRSRSMRRLVRELLKKENIDLIQCEYNLSALNLPKGIKIPRVLVEHDVSMKPYRRFMMSSRSILTRLNGFMQSWLWEYTEPRLCSNFNAIVTLTPEDMNYLQQHGVDVHIDVIPPPVNVHDVTTIKKSDRVCFIGSFNREANQEALEEILYAVWPEIQRIQPGCQLRIAGKHLKGKLLSQIENDPQAEYDRFVEDIDSYIAECSLFLAPIRLGGGLKMKITHALACGTPVVTTSVGAEGIPLTDQEGLFVEDDSLMMAKLVIDLLSSPDKMKQISATAMAAVKSKFSLESALGKYEQLYSNLLV
jgi:glycosyltransferase involved in cell wall biosynthesis